MDDELAHEYPVIHKMYRLALEYTQRVRRFPRDTRFVLGDRVLLNCYAILEGLVAARYAQSKAELLQAQNLRLEQLRFQTRLCRDLGIISARQYGFLAEHLDEVGRMIGGWLRRQRRQGALPGKGRPPVARGVVEQQQPEELPRRVPEQQ